MIHDPITPSGEIIIDGSERKSGKPRSSKEKVHSSINSPEHFAYIVVSGSVVLEVDYSAFYELSFIFYPILLYARVEVTSGAYWRSG